MNTSAIAALLMTRRWSRSRTHPACVGSVSMLDFFEPTRVSWSTTMRGGNRRSVIRPGGWSGSTSTTRDAEAMYFLKISCSYTRG